MNVVSDKSIVVLCKKRSVPVLEMYEKKLQSEDVITDYMTGADNAPEDAEYYYKRIMDETEDMNLRSYNFSKGIANGQSG